MKHHSMLLMLAAFQAGICDVVLFDAAFNVNGTIADISLDQSGFDWISGLGTLSFSISQNLGDSPVDYFVYSFFDHEIDEPINTFFNEYGMQQGIKPERLSWEIDEPGYVMGDIYNNLMTHNTSSPVGFDNMIFGGDNSAVDDVSMGIGWDFSLSTGQSATVDFLLSNDIDYLDENGLQVFGAESFYLSHHDDMSRDVIYFASMLTIEEGTLPPQPVAEAGTLSLLFIGLAGCLGMMFQHKKGNSDIELLSAACRFFASKCL